MADLDIFSYLANVANGEQQRQSTRSAIEVALNDIANQTEDQVAAVHRYSEASQQIVAINNQTELQNQAERRAVIDKANLDPTAIGNTYSNTLEWLRGSYERSNQMKQTIDNAESVDFFENPLQFLANQIVLPGLITKYNSEVTTQANKENQLATTIELATKEGKLVNEVKRSTSLEAAQAEARKIAAKGDWDAANIRQQGIQINMDGLSKLQSSRDADLSIQGSALHTVLAFRQFESLEKDRQLRQQEHAWIAEQRKEKAETDANLAEDVNNGLRRLGKNPQPLAVIIAGIKRGDNLMTTASQLGYDMRVNGTTDVPIAANAGQVGRLIFESKAFGKAAEVAGTPENLLYQAYKKVEEDPTKNKLKPDEKAMYASDIAKGAAAKMLNGIKFEDGSNIYQAPPISVVYDAIGDEGKKAMDSNRFYSESLKPLGAQLKLQRADPKIIVGIAAAELKKDPSRVDEIAEGIRLHFEAARRVNARTQNYLSLGLPPQVGYPVEISTNLISNRYNLVNPVDIKTILMKQSFVGENIFTDYGGHAPIMR